MGSIIDPIDDLARRRRIFAQRRSLSEFGVSLPNQPTEILGVHPKDDKFRFFKKGRDFQPRKAKHQFTDEELQVLQTYESASILPSHSKVYRRWLESQPARRCFDSWTIIFLVAFITGILAFVLRLVCEKFQIVYLPQIQRALESDNTRSLWISYTLASCGFGAVSAIVVIYFCPLAAGSGLPEIIGILNGVVIRNVLSFRTLVCKMISAIFVVISKLPVGYEGPMIHIGAMVGACMAKPVSRCMTNNKSDPDTTEEPPSDCCPTGCFSRFCRYRDCQERFSLICVGAASGVASAFSSPITGLTFAMEEISSHWSRKQTWRTFVCCIVARSTTELLRSLEHTVQDRQHFSFFQLSESALFDMKRDLKLSLLLLIPALVLGVLGGLFGAVFIFCHLKASKFRRRMFSYIRSPHKRNGLKLLEVVVIAAICGSFVVGSLPFFPCKDVTSEQVSRNSKLQLQSFGCSSTTNSGGDFRVQMNNGGQFNEAASLLMGSWEQTIRNLLTRKTSNIFGIRVLGVTSALFVFFSCWTSMTSVSCGLLIPQLAIGALYGRMLGETLHNCLAASESSIMNWDWIDPGIFALMGAASFISGTSRLPITSVVMMVELTNDINMVMVVMVCVMVAKFIGDLFTHSLYHSILEVKCIPYLDSDLKVYDSEGGRINLELFTSSTVMHVPVICVRAKESVRILANLLLDTNHGAFPVISNDDGLERTYLGIISRLELTILLTKTERFDPREIIERDDVDRLRITYPEYSSTRLKDAAAVNVILNRYSSSVVYKNIFINLKPYINVSAPSVAQNFCLRRTYMMFTAMGLRHLIVTDRLNQVVGVITRKDLMGYAVERRVQSALMKKAGSFSSDLSGEGEGLFGGGDCDIEVKSTVPVVEEEVGSGASSSSNRSCVA